MKEVLSDYATRALAWLESGVAFIAGEVPKYIEELLRWKLTEEIFFSVFMLILAVVCGLTVKWCYKKGSIVAKENSYGWYDSSAMGYLMGVIFGLMGVIGFLLPALYNIKDILYIIVAPRVYMIDYIGTLIK
jgi:uncharacterized membrane protein YfcA